MLEADEVSVQIMKRLGRGYGSVFFFLFVHSLVLPFCFLLRF